VSDAPDHLDDDLRGRAADFAERLTRLISDVIPGSNPPFAAQVLPGFRPRLEVAPVQADDPDAQHSAIVMSVRGRVRTMTLTLRVSYFLTWDSSGRHLTVEESTFGLGIPKVQEPFFRWDYDRSMHDSQLPAAHIQVHAHRDEVGFLMTLAAKGRPQRRERAEELPRLAELHLPVGGDRYRPCLEDVLQIAIVELGADAKPGWERVLARERAHYRRLQLAAAVRDSPETAARVLSEELGYTVTRAEGAAPDRPRRLEGI
jgi:hypothetical protein